jgi:hypothetical protein
MDRWGWAYRHIDNQTYICLHASCATLDIHAWMICVKSGWMKALYIMDNILLRDLCIRLYLFTVITTMCVCNSNHRCM